MTTISLGSNLPATGVLTTLVLFVLLILSSAFLPAPDGPRIARLVEADTVRGAAVFEDECSTCHTLRPPEEDAPPMLMVVQHYMAVHKTEAKVKGAIMAWVPAPDSAKSALPAHAIEKFDLMPEVQLDEADLSAVVDYILAKYQEAKAFDTMPACDESDDSESEGECTVPRGGMMQKSDTSGHGMRMMGGAGKMGGKHMMTGAGKMGGKHMMTGAGKMSGKHMMAGAGKMGGKHMMAGELTCSMRDGADNKCGKHDADMGKSMQCNNKSTYPRKD